jgi:tape measure domain-containing protein
MATDTERLIFLLEANTKSLEAGLARAQKTADRRMGAMESRAVQMEKRLQASFAKGGQGLANLIGGTAVTAVIAATVKGTAGLADSYTNLSNQTKLYTNTTAEAARATQMVIDQAADARVPLAELTKVFAGASRAAVQLGATSGEVEVLTEVIAKGAAIGGASQSALAGGLTQLSQALGSTKIQAEEFNSIIDGLPAVAQAAANGIDAAGGSVGKLQQIVRDGELTNSQLFRGLLSQLPAVQKLFAETTPTIAGSFEVLRTRLIEFIGGADDAANATENISKFIIGLADNVELLGDASRVFIGEMGKIAGVVVPIAAVAAAIVALNRVMVAYRTLAAVVALSNFAMGTSMTVAGVAAGGFTAAMGRLIAVSRAFMLTPIGLAITAVGIAIAIATANTLKKVEADRLAQEQSTRLKDAADSYVVAAIAEANATDKGREAARRFTEEMRAKTAGTRADTAETLKAIQATAALAKANFEAAGIRRGEAQAIIDAPVPSGGLTPNQALEIQGRKRVAQRTVTLEAGNEARALVAVARLNADVMRLRNELGQADARVAEGNAARTAGGVRATGVAVEPAKEPKGPKAKTAEQLARERETAANKLRIAEERAQRAAEDVAQFQRRTQQNALENQIELAKLRRENTDSLEDQVAVMQRADQIAKDGVPTAQETARAQAQVNTVRTLINENRAREIGLIETADDLEIKRLYGLYEQVSLAEDALAVEQKTNEYLSQGLSIVEATAKAKDRVGQLRRAESSRVQEDLANEAERLRIARLEAEGEFGKAEAAQRVFDVKSRTKELEEKRVANAAEVAEATQKELDAVRQIDRLREREADRWDDEIEILRLRGLDKEADRQERVRDAEREERRRAERDGRSYDPDTAGIALDNKDKAKLEGDVRTAWRQGVRAALDGDFRDFLSNVLSKAFDRAADNLADALFDVFKNIPTGTPTTSSGGEGSGWLAAAAKIIPFLFGGGKANGGQVKSGTSYLVGENGPEMFTAGANGVINNGRGTRGGGSGPVTIYVNAKDAVLASQLRRDMQQAVVQGVSTASAYQDRYQKIDSRYKGK